MSRSQLELALIIILVSASMLQAGSVFVKGQEIGQGYTRARGPECFVITAAHVVGEYSTVDVVSYAGVRGTADVVEKLAGDISVLRIAGQGTSFCSTDSEWANGIAFKGAPNSISSWSLDMTDERGTIEQKSLDLVAFDPNFLYVKMRDPNSVVQRGMSGSPVRGDGYFMGIMIADEPGTDGRPQGRIMRLNYLDALLQSLFFTGTGTVRELDVAELQVIDTNIALAKLALDQHKDCATARQALQAVPVMGRRGAFWHLYMARSAECLGDFETALKEYTEYNTLVPGQRAILEKMAAVGYELRRKGTASNLRRDLTGYWIKGDTFFWFEQMSDNSVRAYVAGAKTGRPTIGELALEGTYANGVLDGYRYLSFGPRVFEECDNKLSIARDREPWRTRLSITEDGQTIRGDRTDKRIQFSDCSISTTTVTDEFKRLPDAVPSNVSEIRPRLSREEILREIAVRDRFRSSRNNLAGSWTTPEGDVVEIRQDGYQITGTFTLVSDYTASRTYYTAGKQLFSGTYRYGALHGKISLGWTRQEVEACRLTPGLDDVDGRIEVADDGSSLEVYGFAAKLGSYCVRDEDKRQGIKLARSDK